MSRKADIKNTLISLLKTGNFAGSTLLFRGENERNYLFDIINREADSPVCSAAETGDINLMLQSCSACPGVAGRKTPFGSGSSGLMIVLNAPRMANRVELSIHRAESAELLRKMINAIDIDLKTCYVTNLIKCETDDLLFKPSDMIRNCLTLLDREIGILKPVAVLVMGDILPLQSIIKSSRGIAWFNVEHTITLIKNPSLKKEAWKTLQLLRDKLPGFKNVR